MTASQAILNKPTASVRPAFTPVRSGLLQRKCACGGKADADGECEECRKKKLQLKANRTDHGAENTSVPPLVHEVLRSPGHSLDAETRAFMEPRFGHDFSRVKLHTDGQADRAANQLGALAFTVGQHIAFRHGAFATRSLSGRRLLAHELAHTVQQAETPLGIQRQLYPPVPIMVKTATALEVNAIDARQETRTPWYFPWRYTGPVTNFFRGDVTMTDTASMATNVLGFLRGRKMQRLNVMDHGNKDGLEIGDDWLKNPADVVSHSGDLKRIGSSFSSGAFVHMQNCHAGQNRGLICALANAFGVPVFAGTGLHNPLLNLNFGDYVRCEPGGAFNPDAGRPQTPPSPDAGGQQVAMNEEPPAVQAKLAVAPAGTPLEHEADRIAEQVVVSSGSFSLASGNGRYPNIKP